MGGRIYLMGDDGGLVGMNERGYDSEALLQGYLARHHDLLAGDQIDGASPRRWLLVSQEMSLASEEDGSGRWAVDHLFLDQDAVPTIVEVKRSADTRIRREVVGQMLDYAANGVSYWSVDILRAQFDANPESEQDILDLLEDPDADPEEFWQEAKRNLQAGRVRLIFVSDRIPDELRRIVEFLNEQMSPAEVLAVEIKQYVSEDSKLRTLVPRVIGQTVKAQDHKSGGGNPVDEDIFFRELETSQGAIAAMTVRKIQEWAQGKLPRSAWQRNGRHAAFYPCLDHGDVPYFPFRIGADGRVGIVFMWLNAGKPPFGEDGKREELLRRLNEVSGVEIPAHRTNGIPAFPLSVLVENEAALNQFLEVFDWFVEEVKAT